MRKAILTLVLATGLWCSEHGNAQNSGSEILPAFKIALKDSSYVIKRNLRSNNFLILVYFQPDCDHCIEFGKQIAGYYSKLKNIQVLMITNQELSTLAGFENITGLVHCPKVTIGTEGYTRVIQRHYNISKFPFVAVFNKQQQQIQLFPDQPELSKVIGVLRQRKN